MIRKIESKSFCRKIANDIGVPVIPGSHDPVDIDKATEYLEMFGPILIKADLGGGGKGMKIVKSKDELHNFFESAQREANIAFGSSKVYVEKLLEKPRHIEVQILADKYDNIISLGERECSIQRRHQKIIEESPSPVVDKKTREYISSLAKKLARKISYVNAGTIEFLRDRTSSFYFLEINKRLQVEHPVTEYVTGIDLVEQQLKIATGETLFQYSDLKPTGHAMEARIYAEDPVTFLPSPGKITEIKIPKGIRVDHELEPGIDIPPYYDPLIAKAIAYSNNRQHTIYTLRKALEEFEIKGIKVNIPLLQKILDDKKFQEGDINTEFLNKLI